MQEIPLKDRVLAYLRAGLRFLVLKVALFALGIGVLVGLSFLIWQGFNAEALSERMVWTGIGLILVTGILTFSSTVGGRDYGSSGAFLRSAHVQNIIDFNIEVRQQIEQKFDLRIQFFLVGLAVLGLGALVQVLFAA